MERTFDGKVELDERSKDYPVRKYFATNRKRSYTWRCDQTLDQGPDGACVGFAWAHELIARPSEVSGIDNEFAKEQIYFTAQKLDRWEGGAYPNSSEEYEGTSVLAGAKAAVATGFIAGYHWAFGLDDLIIGVGHRGPAVIGVNWYEGMLDTNADGFVLATGDVLGGHAVLVRGVNVNGGYFIIRNSWGEDWGINGGDCLISFSDMKKLLDERGVACFATGRRTKIPTR